MNERVLWYKDAVIYEIRIRAFYDSDDDGIGDIQGLIEKLDYVQDLGVTAIWLLPFYPSPLRDDGYDISDYTTIHPSLGTIQEFKILLKEAHKRGLKVITELVLNHTSDQHPWFKRARLAPPGSVHRDFYVWNDSPDKYKEARIIFKDYEPSNWTWDPVAKAYFWHRFYGHQPDLNFENPAVHEAVFQILDYWFNMGIDGLRLDAVPYLYEKEGTNCENLPQTHQYLKKLRAHIDSKFKNRMLLAEANQWPEDAVVYFGNGDECHMAFHFPIMPRLFMAIHREDRYPVIDILDQTPAIPENCQWATFLRNHDELTLEMVTDEERDYMYKVYAQDPQARVNLGIRRRLAPLLGNHRRKIELMNGLLFSLPGTPVLYYGDEIGMGDNIYLGDRNSVRTPMQWSADRNAGFSRANPQKLYMPINTDPEYHFETVNVESNQNNPHSLYWWMKRLIALRKKFAPLSQGTIEFLAPQNPKVLAFIRKHENQTILVVANLSRFVQFVELNLAEYKGLNPIEVFGRIQFPSIGDLPYFITLGPHAFYWFSIEAEKTEEVPIRHQEKLPTITAQGKWSAFIEGKSRTAIEDHLPSFLKDHRWFAGKGRHIKSVKLTETVPLEEEISSYTMAFARVEYTEGAAEIYALPLGFAQGDHMNHLMAHAPNALLARLELKQKNEMVSGIIYDAVVDERFSNVLLNAIEKRKTYSGINDIIEANTTKAFKNLRGDKSQPLTPSLINVEQSNSSTIFGDRFIMKLFRRHDTGMNPDLEISRALLEETKFRNLPQLAGTVEILKGKKGDPSTIALLQEFVPNQGDAWSHTLDHLGVFFERVFSHPNESPDLGSLSKKLVDLAKEPAHPLTDEWVGSYLTSAKMIGQRTAELHLALASMTENPAFKPEPMTPFVQRSFYQSFRDQAKKTLNQLQKRINTLPENTKQLAKSALSFEDRLQNHYDLFRKKSLKCSLTRIHGDYHLGQLLFTGKDFYILDFEGEPARSISERRIKHSPFRDVAGMIRSFHYAAFMALREQAAKGTISEELLSKKESWALFWAQRVSAAFLNSYLEHGKDAVFIPNNEEDRDLLLSTYLFEKVLYEIGYELNNRPDWLSVPLRGFTHLSTIWIP